MQEEAQAPPSEVSAPATLLHVPPRGLDTAALTECVLETIKKQAMVDAVYQGIVVGYAADGKFLFEEKFDDKTPKEESARIHKKWRKLSPACWFVLKYDEFNFAPEATKLRKCPTATVTMLAAGAESVSAFLGTVHRGEGFRPMNCEFAGFADDMPLFSFDSLNTTNALKRN